MRKVAILVVEVDDALTGGWLCAREVFYFPTVDSEPEHSGWQMMFEKLIRFQGSGGRVFAQLHDSMYRAAEPRRLCPASVSSRLFCGRFLQNQETVSEEKRLLSISTKNIALGV